MPFKGLLLGLFFMTVGMSINMEFLIANLAIVIGLSAAIIIIKSGIIMALCHAAKMPKSRGVQAGLLLAQGGEFAFVLFGIALHTGILPRDVSQILLVVVSVTMALTPLLAMAGRKIAGKIDKGKPAKMERISEEAANLKNHVIIAGFGRMGQTIGRLLALEEIQYIALDTDPKRIYKARLQGFPVYYGDASRMEVLNALGIAKAGAVIVTTNSVRASKMMVERVHDNFPHMPLFARAKDLDGVQDLENSGATLVVPETLETSLRLGAAALYHFGLPEHEVERVIRLFRSRDYMAAKEEPAAAN
jgi:CPA2 family monovalent cation:H+ antiporter-2